MATSRRATRVWKRFATWYGARFLEQFGKEPPEDWRETIDRTDDERLDHALMRIRREYVNHPPTLGQFEAAIPQKRIDRGGPSIPTQLSNYAVKAFSLCAHQLRGPWHYFGPVEEFHHKGRSESHPTVAGVVIPECSACGNKSHRVKVEDLDHSAAA